MIVHDVVSILIHNASHFSHSFSPQDKSILHWMLVIHCSLIFKYWNDGLSINKPKFICLEAMALSVWIENTQFQLVLGKWIQSCAHVWMYVETYFQLVQASVHFKPSFFQLVLRNHMISWQFSLFGNQWSHL